MIKKTTDKVLDDGTVIQTEKTTGDLEKSLSSYPNYVGYATDVGKIRGGMKTGEECVTIFVKEKTPMTELSPDEVFPSTLGKLQTDIVEIGEVVAENLNDYKKRYEYIPAGVSMGNRNITAGTYGGLVYDPVTSEVFAATNTHVGLPSMRKNVGEQDKTNLQPGPADGGRNPADIVGDVAKAIIVPPGYDAFNDFCNVRPTAREFVANTLKHEVIPTGTATIQVGDHLWKEGRTTGYTIVEVLSLNATVNVNYGGEDGVITHKYCILTTNGSAGGDSGSWYYKKVSGPVGSPTHEDTKVAAYGFAGSPTITVLHDIHNALNALGVKVFTKDAGSPDELVMKVRLTPLSGNTFRITGTVVDDTSEKALEGVEVSLETVVDEALQLQVTTGTDGTFIFIDVPKDAVYRLTCVKEGFVPWSKEFEA